MTATPRPETRRRRSRRWSGQASGLTPRTLTLALLAAAAGTVQAAPPGTSPTGPGGWWRDERGVWRRAGADAEALLFGVPAARAAGSVQDGPTLAQWAGPTSGTWSNAALWSSNPFAPNNGSPSGTTYHAIIGASGSAYTVTLDSGIALDALTLGSADATLRHTAGVLEIGGAFDLTAGQYTLDGGTLRGATLNFGGGSFSATTNANNRFDGVTVNGNWSLPSGSSTLRVSNGLTLGSGGVLTMSTGFGHQLLAFDGDQTLSGGTVVLDAALPQQFASATIAVEGDSTLTITPGTTIRGGWGTIGAQNFVAGDNAVVNQGTISAEVASRAVRIVSDSFTNQGLAEAKNGGTLDIQSASWTNPGTISATGSTLTLSGQWTSSGAINATNSTVNLLGQWSNLGTLTATNSTVNLGGTFSGGSLGAFTRTGGVVNITGMLENTGQVLALNAGTGSWRLKGGTITGGTITQTGGASLIVAEDNANRLVGVSISGDLNLLESHALAIVNDGLSVSGTARLGQTAELSFVGDQTVQGGTFQIQGHNARLRAGGTVEFAPGTLVTNFGPYAWSIMDAEGPASGDLVGRGTIRSTGAGSRLDFMLADFTNLRHGGGVRRERAADRRVGGGWRPE